MGTRQGLVAAAGSGADEAATQGGWRSRELGAAVEEVVPVVAGVANGSARRRGGTASSVSSGMRAWEKELRILVTAGRGGPWGCLDGSKALGGRGDRGRRRQRLVGAKGIWIGLWLVTLKTREGERLAAGLDLEGEEWRWRDSEDGTAPRF